MSGALTGGPASLRSVGTWACRMLWPLRLRRVVGNSMAPSLKHGQLIVVVGGRWRMGDAVLVLHNGLEKVKRVAKVDGERVFVVGDNLAESTDSRDFGWLNADAVRGKILLPRT